MTDFFILAVAVLVAVMVARVLIGSRRYSDDEESDA